MKTISFFRVVDGMEMSSTSVLTDEQYNLFEELTEKHPELTDREIMRMTTAPKPYYEISEIPTLLDGPTAETP